MAALVTTLVEADVDDRAEAAAETVAADYSQFDADHLLDALESAAFGERVQSFERHGEPLGKSAVTETFREQAVGDHIEAETDTTVEAVVEAFLAELQSELAAEPVVWRRIALESVRRTGSGVDALLDEIDSLRAELETMAVEAAERALAAADTAADQGFDWLTAADFEAGYTDDDYCWRRAFKLPEVRAGYPLERERPLADGGRRRLTEEVFDALDSHDGAVLLGPAGSGKTTATRTALSAWEARTDGGTVLYHTGERIERPLGPEALITAVDTARENGPVLVAVEDAARRGTAPVFDVVEEYAGEPDVQFLLNSRSNEWDSDDAVRAAVGDGTQRARDALAGRREYLEPIRMPPLDAQEVERFVTNYERVTGDTPSAAGDETAIHEQIHGQRGISPMLLLAYHVPAGDGVDAHTDGPKPALLTHVKRTFELLHGDRESREIPVDSEREATLLRRIGLAVNVINAAELAVHTEFLLTLGDDDAGRETITELCDRVRGPLLFEAGGNPFLFEADDHPFGTHHPLWSRLYLSHHLNTAGGTTAISEFETVVNDLFAVFDDDQLREGIRKTLRGDTELLENIENQPTEAAREFVTDVFEIGEDRPELQPLYGTSAYSGVELPEAGGARGAVEAAFSRSRMFNSLGEPDDELDEIERAWERATEAGIDSEVINAKYHTRQGHYARRQGEFEEARDHYSQVLEIIPSEEKSQAEAATLGNLGLVARNLGEYEQAREYHDKSLAIRREISDRAGEATSLNNLGLVAQSFGEYEQAREYHEKSLAIKREIGDRAGEATSLGNLGAVAQSLGKYEQAREYHEESLAIEREIGDRAGEATSLNNLGAVAQSLGEYEQAREYYEETLAIQREIGDRAGEATSLDGLGSVAGQQGNYETAEQRHREALAISDEIGDRASVATQQFNIGVEAQQQDEFERALAWFRKSRQTRGDLGADRKTLESLRRIVRVATELEQFETAREACVDALELIADSDLALDDHAREFQVHRARLDESPEGTFHLYYHALGHANEGDLTTAADLLNATWRRREVHDEDSDAFAPALAAGVALAGLLDSRTFAADVGTDADTVLSAVEAHESRLGTPERELYDTLRGDDPETTPDELQEAAAEMEPESFAQRLVIVEHSVFAELLANALADRELADAPVETLYERALAAVSREETERATELFERAWRRREHHDPDTAAHGHATAAGVGLAAHRVLLADADPAETALTEIDDTTALSPAVTAVATRLSGGDPEPTADELRAGVDPDGEPSLEEVETMVFAGMMGALDNR
jgi:tetratricopeptide (TPR) repeat protein